MSASAIRRSSASTNSSTGWPVSPAKAANRSFRAASTLIVAFGIIALLSHADAVSASAAVALTRFWSPWLAVRLVPKLGPRNLDVRKLCENQHIRSVHWPALGAGG